MERVPWRLGDEEGARGGRRAPRRHRVNMRQPKRGRGGAALPTAVQAAGAGPSHSQKQPTSYSSHQTTDRGVGVAATRRVERKRAREGQRASRQSSGAAGLHASRRAELHPNAQKLKVARA